MAGEQIRNRNIRPTRSGSDRRVYSKHGLNGLKRRVKVRGMEAIDRRTRAARALSAWRNELIGDLGGADALSAQQLAVVELATRTKLLLDSVDVWLLKQPTLINKRRKALLPVVRERTQLADALARYLSQLGLERRSKPVLDLSAYLAQKGQGDQKKATVSPRGEKARQTEKERGQHALEEATGTKKGALTCLRAGRRMAAVSPTRASRRPRLKC